VAFAEIELARIKKVVGGFCDSRVPAHVQEKLRLKYSVNRHDVVVFEVRPHWRIPGKDMREEVAKFKFVRSRNEWRLYWMRADLKWHSYDPLPSSRDLEELVGEVDEDPYCCFFG